MNIHVFYSQCVKGIDFLHSLLRFSIIFWSCSDYVVSVFLLFIIISSAGFTTVLRCA
jgi:hypothetical protein